MEYDIKIWFVLGRVFLPGFLLGFLKWVYPKKTRWVFFGYIPGCPNPALLQIYCTAWWWKNFENRLAFRGVTGKNKVAPFFRTQCRVSQSWSGNMFLEHAGQSLWSGWGRLTEAFAWHQRAWWGGASLASRDMWPKVAIYDNALCSTRGKKDQEVQSSRWINTCTYPATTLKLQRWQWWQITRVRTPGYVLKNPTGFFLGKPTLKNPAKTAIFFLNHKSIFFFNINTN